MRASSPITLLLLIACGPTSVDYDGADGVASLTVTDVETRAVLDLVNDPQTDFARLDHAVGLDRRAARAIIERRNGDDGVAGTDDDVPFESLEALDAIAFVGNAALKRLLEYASANGYLEFAPAPIEVPVRAGVRMSDRVFIDVMHAYDLSDAANLFERALRFDDGNRYIKRSELEAAAQSMVDDLDYIGSYRFSEAVVHHVMATFGVVDRLELLVSAAMHHDDGNRYLKTMELQAAALSVGGERLEFGVIADIDRTLLPPSSSDDLAAPYPGVAALLRAVDTADGRRPGDVFYVTARSPDRMDGIEDWMRAHGLPAGPIATGISGVPHIAEREKIADITAILESRPGQAFVLFGDANHRDPEVYRAIRNTFGPRVVIAFIHRVRTIDDARAAGLVVIDNYAEAAARLLRSGVFDESTARRVMIHAQNEGLQLSDADIDALVRANHAVD